MSSKMQIFTCLRAEEIALLDKEYTKANNCLSTIEDPLWKRVCCEIIDMMGPASFLKIWKSKLGQLSSQDSVLEIICETAETAAFIQQYDFVILASLQQFFPALKRLRATGLTVLPH